MESTFADSNLKTKQNRETQGERKKRSRMRNEQNNATGDCIRIKPQTWCSLRVCLFVPPFLVCVVQEHSSCFFFFSPPVSFVFQSRWVVPTRHGDRDPVCSIFQSLSLMLCDGQLKRDTMRCATFLCLWSRPFMTHRSSACVSLMSYLRVWKSGQAWWPYNLCRLNKGFLLPTLSPRPMNNLFKVKRTEPNAFLSRISCKNIITVFV